MSAPGLLGERARQLAGLAARLLGWRPGEFWAATPAELVAALQPGGDAGARPLGRDELNRMMEREHGQEPRG